jgi:membrane protein
MSELHEKLHKLKKFVLHDVWSIELAGASGARGVISRLIRTIHLVIRGYYEDALTTHAGALTFSFLMSLVPVLAIASALLNGLGGGKSATKSLLAFTDSMPAEAKEFVANVVAIVERTNFVALGWAGVIVLFITATQVLANIEDSFNKIWGVKEPRSWWKRFTNYTSLTIMVPMLVTAGFALSASVRSGFLKTAEFAWLNQGLLYITPLFATWLAFFLLYTFMPNTRVEKRASVTAALFAALMWLGWQKVYLVFQFGLARYNAIYGTFASIPVFLFWMFIGWTIILLGAEFCFAVQNQATYHLERIAQSANVEARLTLALGLLAEATETFARGSTTFNTEEFGQARHVPSRLIHDIVRLLVRGGLLVEVAGQPGQYALNRTPEKIRVKEVFDLLLQDGTAASPLGLTKNLHPSVNRVLAAWNAGGADSLGAKSLADLIAESPALQA